MLFRTAKLNYQIKQQRRYINKIDFVRRSLSLQRGRARRFASNLVSRNSRFNQVARLKRSLFIFVINPTYTSARAVRDERAEVDGGEEAAGNLITLSKCTSRRSPLGAAY